MEAKKESGWKTFAIVITAIAGFIGAVGAFLSDTLPFFAEDTQTAQTPATVETPIGPSPEAEQATGRLAAADASTVPPKPLTDDQAIRAAERAMADLLNAMKQGDVDRLVAMSDTPFLWHRKPLLTTKAEIRDLFEELYGGPTRVFPAENPSLIKAHLVRDIRATSGVTNRITLSDDDVLVELRYGQGDGVYFYFRREADGVTWAGTRG